MNEKEFMQYYKQGFSDVKISKIMGVCESTIGKLRNKIGLKPNNRIVITDEDFFKLYNKGLTDKQISEQSGTSESSVRRRRKKYNLPIHKSYTEANKLLKKYFMQYHNEGKNDSKIAVLLGISKNAVNNYRISLGLQPIGKEKIDLQKVKKLFNEGKTDKEISEIINYSIDYIKSCRHKLGLKLMEAKKAIDYQFNDKEYQVIIGSLLGDGNISMPKYKNGGSTLYITHSIKQKEYIEFKYKILKNMMCELREYDRIDYRFNITNKMCEIYSHSIKQLIDFRNRWYIPNKRVCYDDVKKLGPLGLAIWYMDDGYKCKPYGGCILCTNCFPREDLEILKKVLKDNFNIIATSNIKKDNVLYIPSKEFPKFKEVVEPYIVPCLKYKVSS